MTAVDPADWLDADGGCAICGRTGHDMGRIEAEVEGRARMAAARRHAGVELDERDRLALEAFPDPSLLGGAL